MSRGGALCFTAGLLTAYGIVLATDTLRDSAKLASQRLIVSYRFPVSLPDSSVWDQSQDSPGAGLDPPTVLARVASSCGIQAFSVQTQMQQIEVGHGTEQLVIDPSGISDQQRACLTRHQRWPHLQVLEIS